MADTRAALAWLRSETAVRDFGVDTRRIVVAGHSMGGYMAAHGAVVEACPAPGREGRISSVCAFHPPLAGVILLDAGDIAADARRLQAAGPQGRAAFIAGFDDIGRSLGPITAADIYENLMRRGTEWDLTALAPKLARMPVLTVYATHGGAAENKALAGAIRPGCPLTDGTTDCGTLLTALELNTDHAFADHRVELARAVVGWLSKARSLSR